MLIKRAIHIKPIYNDMAIIKAKGITSNDDAATSTMLPAGITANLKGKQQGEFELGSKADILISCRSKSRIDRMPFRRIAQKKAYK